MTRGGHRKGLTLAETVVSIVLVGGVVAVALQTVGASTVANQKTTDRGRGHLLAEALMAEILQQSYEEPGATALFGMEPPESNSSRAHYDDVDDYHNLSESPPKDRTGAALPGWAGWSRSVHVSFVEPDDLRRISLVDHGVKRITITVSHGNRPVAAMIAVRARIRNGAVEGPGLPMDLVLIPVDLESL